MPITNGQQPSVQGDSRRYAPLRGSQTRRYLQAWWMSPDQPDITPHLRPRKVSVRHHPHTLRRGPAIVAACASARLTTGRSHTEDRTTGRSSRGAFRYRSRSRIRPSGDGLTTASSMVVIISNCWSESNTQAVKIMSPTERAPRGTNDRLERFSHRADWRGRPPQHSSEVVALEG